MYNILYLSFYFRNNNLLRYLTGTPASLTTLQVRGNRRVIYILKIHRLIPNNFTCLLD